MQSTTIFHSMVDLNVWGRFPCMYMCSSINIDSECVDCTERRVNNSIASPVVHVQHWFLMEQH